MMGLITQFLTRPEDRDALAAILAAGSADMPGCVSYVVLADVSRDDALWVTELWTDTQHHLASLALPHVRDAVTEGRRLITAVAQRTTTEVLSRA